MLHTADGEIFAAGVTEYEFRPVQQQDINNRILLHIQVAGQPVLAAVDTGGAFLILAPLVAVQLGLDPQAAIAESAIGNIDQSRPKTSKSSPTPAHQGQVVTVPTPKIAPSSTPRQCHSWNEITIVDKGRTLCVTGIVKRTYFSSELFYITFSDNSSDFRLVVSDGYYFKDLVGNCVMTIGKVETYGKLPYIRVTDKLAHCK